jgi:hypothetical protein
MDFSGVALDETELGGVTAKASGGFCLVAKMKNESRRKATSHIAVISMLVLLRGILILGIPLVFYVTMVQVGLFSTKLFVL